MGLEVWNSSTSQWDAMTDPEVFVGPNESDWVNINKGEVFVGPNETDWVTFYRRNNNEVYSDLDTVSKTKTSIRLGVNHTGTDRRRAVVWISGQFLATARNTQVFTSNMVASNALAQVNFTNFAINSEHTFDSWIEYLDANDNVTSRSPTMPVLHTDTTLDYTIVVPTKPVNTGTVSSTILSFNASSNAAYSNNGVAASVQFTLYNSLGDIQESKSVALPNDDKTYERTVTFYDVGYGAEYTCKARTYYGGAIADFSAYSASSDTVSTNTFHVPVAPVLTDSTEDSITMTTNGNAYSNGEAYMRWEKATRPASSNDDNDWLYSYYSDSGNLLTDDSTSRFVSYTFTGLNQTDEYKFRARVYYGDLTAYPVGKLGITNGYAAEGPSSVIVRPKLWVRQYKPSSTTYAAASDTDLFPGSSFGASSENAPYVKGNVSDGSSGTFWESNPSKTVTGTARHVRTLRYFKRSAGGLEPWVSTYYKDGGDDFDFDAAYPDVSTTVANLYYGITSMIYNAKSERVTLTLAVTNFITLEANDVISVSDNSVASYNRQYVIESTSGARTFILIPYGLPSTTASGTGGIFKVLSSRGVSIGQLGGTSARTGSVANNYVQREDGEYGYDVPFSSATGSISWTVGTSTKVDKTSSDTDNISVLFVPALPAAGTYQNARLEEVTVKIGTPAATRIKVEMNGTERFDSAGGGAPLVAESTFTLAGFSTPPTYAGNAFLINCIVYPGLYVPDGKYYSIVKEIQIRYSYETLTG